MSERDDIAELREWLEDEDFEHNSLVLIDILRREYKTLEAKYSEYGTPLLGVELLINCIRPLFALHDEASARAVRCEGVDADYAALVEVAQGVNTSLRLLPLTGINDAQHIYDAMYKILDRLARWLIDTPDYPGKPAPREIPSRP